MTMGAEATRGSELTAEQRQMLLEGSDGAGVPDDDVDDEEDGEEIPSASVGTGVPAWCPVPEGFTPPPDRQLTFLLFRAPWTDTPNKGDRSCILWNLTETDEKLALKRTRGEAMRTLDELAKQCIRVIDGHAADWTGRQGPGSVERWWRDIGAKCRQQVKNLYVKTHTLDAKEAADFFTNCVAVRTAVG